MMSIPQIPKVYLLCQGGHFETSGGIRQSLFGHLGRDRVCQKAEQLPIF